VLILNWKPALAGLHRWAKSVEPAKTTFSKEMVKAGKFYCHYEAAEVTTPFAIEAGLTFAAVADAFCAKYNAKHGSGPGGCHCLRAAYRACMGLAPLTRTACWQADSCLGQMLSSSATAM
jgi:hypothetical protein